MIDHLLRFVAPHSCCGCGYFGTILCDQCNDDIVSEPFTQCLVCLGPTSVTNLCGRCASSVPYDAAWCVGVRRDTLKLLLDRYKFDAVRQVAQPASGLLDARLPVLAPDTVIVPVPVTGPHRRTRGFDHMTIITRRLATARHLRHANVLATDRTDTQHFKTLLERRLAAASGLRLICPVPQRVLLVDDIYTTGSTINACAAALRAHGARDVSVAIIARQTLDESDDL